MLLLVSLLFLPSLAPARAVRRASPVATLQSRLGGSWQDMGRAGIRLTIQPKASGGTILYRRGRTFNERSAYRVIGRDTILVQKPRLTYRIRFTKAGMEWRLVGGRGNPRRYRRLAR
jgi:hypothetical protein